MKLKNISNKNIFNRPAFILTLSFLFFMTISICCQALPALAGNSGEVMKISKTVFNTDKEQFIPHTDDHPFGSYIIQYLPYEPVKSFFRDLEKKTNQKLKNRGEAHITIITPVEYNTILKPFVSIQEITDLALKMDIQSWDFKILGLGKAQAEVNKKTEQTYYIIVRSLKALEFRSRVFDMYVKNGGHASRFDPFQFYPHITVGFTQRDLYESDGIFKGTNSRICKIEVIE
jgi:hypothetical protein